MTALAELLDEQQAAALARLQLRLITAPPPAGKPSDPVAKQEPAVCPACGQPKPTPATVFRPAGEPR